MSSTDVVRHWCGELERLQRLLGKVGPDEVCCEGLTQRQCEILRTLVAQEGAQTSRLAARSGVTKGPMTRAIQTLEARGLVERVRGAGNDLRAVWVRITPKGRETCKLLDDLMRQRSYTIMSAIPPKERPALLKALKIINKTIAKLAAPPLRLRHPL